MTIGRIPSVEGGIQPTIVDAKGDILTATAADTPAVLAVGNNGETLVADSSATTGLRWTATPSASNPVLNSAFQVWQRGTSINSSTDQYTADRWYTRMGATCTVSRQTTSDTTNLPFIQYCARIQRNSGGTSTTNVVFYQSFESANSIPFAGKTVTLSFYARKGANFSEASSKINTYLISGTGTDQNYAAGYTGSAFPINNQAATLTTTWQRFTFTGTVATTATELTVYFDYTPVGTAGAADYFEITGVQLDVGSVALPFRTYAATLAGELAACQRYYYLHVSGSSKAFCSGWYYSASIARGYVPFKVEMRTTPTLVATSGTNYYSIEGSAGNDFFNTITTLRSCTTGSALDFTTTIAGTAGSGAEVMTQDASASVAFSAEL